MSWVSVIGLGTSAAIGAGTAAYGAYQQGRNQQALGGINYQSPDYSDILDLLNSYTGTDYSGTIGYIDQNYYVPQFQNYTPVNPLRGLQTFKKQLGGKGTLKQKLDRQTRQDNRTFRQNLSELYPTLMGDVRQAGDITSSQLRGEIPQDVADQVQRNAAYQSLMGGFGQDSGIGRALTARDFGLTSMDLQNQGMNNLGSMVNTTQALSPFMYTRMPLYQTPGELQANAISEQRYGNQVFNTNESNYANALNNRLSMISNLMARSDDSQDRAFWARLGLMQSQEDADVGAMNTNSLLNFYGSQADPFGGALASGLGSLSGYLSNMGSMYGGGFGWSSNPYSGYSPNFLGYSDSSFPISGLPIYRPTA